MADETRIAHEQLLSAVAHEFRSPLAVITGYAELLRRRDDPGFRETAVARIEQAAERLSLAIDDLLSLLESDSTDFARRLVELPHDLGREQRRSPTSGGEYQSS
ncbi:MAG: hypothetical protein A2Y55_07870 [Actinobacteria bacterium RBG_16_68_12]|nr:MAG: hypothetical protein A2Y55_07870 [Actinobacteria bacterium RBG_16_68_12]